MTKPIVLCADDYAYSTPISRAILDLASHRRISALSCMTTSPLWPEHGRWLSGLNETVDIGLHLTLVDEPPLTKMPNTAPEGRLPGIGALILKCYFGRLDVAEISAEIRAQTHAFEAVMGFSPRHIDGHLHTHVLPGIRDIVLSVVHNMTPRPWVRNIAERISAIARRGVAVPKSAFLAGLGRRFARDAATHGEDMNDGFSGVYDFSQANSDYGALFEHFLKVPTRRHLILCHPGGPDDTAAHARLRGGEYVFLKSERFADSLARHTMHVGRFAETAP